jgi:hypothetical protein
MNLEQQVCSLELAKKLKELGVKQESLFWWIYNDGMSHWEVHPFSEHWTPLDRTAKRTAAFTVAELGEIASLWMFSKMDEKGRWICEVSEPEGKLLATPSAPTEADARALGLIYLIENKLITV